MRSSTFVFEAAGVVRARWGAGGPEVRLDPGDDGGMCRRDVARFSNVAREVVELQRRAQLRPYRLPVTHAHRLDHRVRAESGRLTIELQVLPVEKLPRRLRLSSRLGCE